MSLRVTEHTFTGATTPISSYDSTKTNLGTLMVQNSGTGPNDDFVGPFPIAIARPMEESTPIAMMFPDIISFSSTIDWVFLIENAAAAAKRIFLYEYNKLTSTYNWKGFITATLPNATNVTRGFKAWQYLHTTGTVGVAAPVSYYSAGTSVALAVTGVVTGVGTTFTQAMVGKMIGFGSTNPALINCWYPIVTFTSTTSITVSGASNAIAASANYVIASCTVTGTSTLFVTDLIAAGTNVTGVAGGLGPRIGFGSTDPTQITQWYQIGAIASDTSLNITTSPGVVKTGTSYVIEELRFAIATTNSTAANGGLMLVKGVGYLDFITAGVTFPAIASAVDNQRGLYWLDDNGAGAVTNQASSGLAVVAETNKQTHYAYVLDGTNTSSVKVYKYNLRANNTVAAGKMQLAGANIVITGSYTVTGILPNVAASNLIEATLGHGPGSGTSYLYFVTSNYVLAGTVTVAGGSTTVTGSGTAFTASMVGLRIGFGSTSPSLIKDWYTIATYTSGTSITVSIAPGAIAAGTSFVVDGGRLYCAATAGITAASTTFITAADARQEVPTGGISAFAATGGMINVQYINTIDRLLITTGSGGGFRQYVTRYPLTDGTPFDHTFGIDDKQQDQSLADSTIGVHFNTASQLLSADVSSTGMVHICKAGTTAALCQMYALPLGAHWTYAASASQRVITASINTSGCVKFNQVVVVADGYIGSGELRISTEGFRVYYRTTNITVNATSSWVLVGDDGDLSAVTPANAIQFMLEFFTIGLTCIPARVMRALVSYEDGSTDTHYQLSTLSDITGKTFVWRFSQYYGGTAPTLQVALFNAATGSSLLTDTTVASANGTWSKSTDGGNSWGAYDTNDKGNDNTYVRYTPTALTDGIAVRAVLTQY